jgi:signal transduction histidine kinase
MPMVFDNLLRNASVHAGESPTVVVTVQKKGNGIQVIISDNGPGVSESVRSHLFEKGVSTRGGGLGLFLSKEIIESMGGQIELLDSDPGMGAKFRVFLPAVY